MSKFAKFRSVRRNRNRQREIGIVWIPATNKRIQYPLAKQVDDMGPTARPAPAPPTGVAQAIGEGLNVRRARDPPRHKQGEYK